MSFLSVCKDVALDVGLEEPSQVFGSTEREHRELIAIAKKANREILNYYDWTELTTTYTITGDGLATAFAMPPDYHRMPKNADVFSDKNLGSSFLHITDQNDWLRRDINGFTTTLGEWCMFGGKINFRPAPALGEVIKFNYISNQIITGKNTFTADADTYVLDEELLRYCMTWKWKAEKGQHVGEDLINFNTEASLQAGNDKGSKIMALGRRRTTGADVYAFPRSLGV